MKKRGAPKKHHLLKTKQIGFRFPAWVVEWLRDQEESQVDLVLHALKKTYKLKEPKV